MSNWKISKESDFYADSEDGEWFGSIPIDDKEGVTVALAVGDYANGSSRDDMKGRANLIAAAPELYEELDSLLDAIASTPELNLGSWGIDTDSAKAVLAKARGEK